MRNRSFSSIDPLSKVLDLLEVRCELSGELAAGGSWSRRFENLDAIKFSAATKGECWYSLDGLDTPVLFKAGDVLITNGLRTLILASDPSLIAGAKTKPIQRGTDGRYQLGKGSNFTMLAGVVQIDSHRRTLLQNGLPPLIHVQSTSEEAGPLVWILSQLVIEMNETSRPGQTFMSTGLAELLFVQTLRAYITYAPASDKGWLKGLADKRLSIALSAIHSEPAHNWNLNELAKKATMSRTAFAVRFREMIGIPPLTYLMQWRMQLAQRELRSGASVAEAANAVGYSSESAFSNAFKRFMEIAPGMYRRTSANRIDTSV